MEEDKLVMVRALRMKKAELRQVRFFRNARIGIEQATRIVGWFPGEDVLGKTYDSGPYVLCANESDEPYLVKPYSYKFEGMKLLTCCKIIPQVFIS